MSGKGLNKTVLGPRLGPFSQPSTNQCCQCFDFNCHGSGGLWLVSRLDLRYSKTSMTRIPKARSPWLIQTSFSRIPRNSSDNSSKQIFKDIFEKFSSSVYTYKNRLIEAILMTTINVPLVYNLEKYPSSPICLLSWPGAMINSQWLEVHPAGTQHQNDVVPTSMRRDRIDVDTTSF